MPSLFGRGDFAMIKVYLAGSIEYSEDSGLIWRREFAKELNSLGIKCIVPNDEEENILNGIDIKELKKKNIFKYKNLMRKFIDLDLSLIDKSDFIVCRWEGEMSAGTFHEVGHAYENNQPLYLVTSFNYVDIPGWFFACFDRVFPDLKSLIDFLDEGNIR